MLRAVERGLTAADFDRMTLGMIIDYIITYNNFNISEGSDKEDIIIEASQAEFDAF